MFHSQCYKIGCIRISSALCFSAITMEHHIVLFFALACIAHGLNNSNECQAPGIKRGRSPRKFIVCVEKDGQLQPIENECSRGLTFDTVRKTCTRVFPRATILQAISQDRMNVSTPTLSFDTLSSTTDSPRWTGNVTASPSNVASSWPELSTTDPTVEPPPTNRPCKGPGAYCSDCNTLSLCVSYNLPTGAKFLKSILDLPCDSGSVCVTQQGCVKKFNSGLCREGLFVCGDVGLYPDLYDCTIFHSCAVGPLGQLINTPVTCSGGLLGNRWNPHTSTCGWSEDDDSCRKSPVPLCTKPLEMRSVGGQIYSICIADLMKHTLSPILFRCPLDLQFNASTYSCVNPIYST